jgi:cytochrome c biogenesis protein CcdA
MTLFLALFAAGLVTILLPCILPLLPIVLGVSVAGQSRWRPLAVIAGMLLSFTGLTFLLQTALNQFVMFALLLQVSTYAALFLFGVGFSVHARSWQLVGGVLAGLSLPERHRRVYQALGFGGPDNALHALQIRALTPMEARREADPAGRGQA